MPTRKAALASTEARPNDGVALIDAMFGDTPGWDQAVLDAAERLNTAREIHALRERHNLTQSELARLAHTTQSVIARLEDAGYRGHSLRMLQRIAVAVDEEVIVRFAPRTAVRVKRVRATAGGKAKVVTRGKVAKKVVRTIFDTTSSSTAKGPAKKRSGKAAYAE